MVLSFLHYISFLPPPQEIGTRAFVCVHFFLPPPKEIGTRAFVCVHFFHHPPQETLAGGLLGYHIRAARSEPLQVTSYN